MGKHNIFVLSRIVLRDYCEILLLDKENSPSEEFGL